MSERPDLFVNKKSSHAEIIEVRIDATMPDITQELLKRSLYEVFGERNAMRRRERIAELWTVDCTFVDNDGEHQGQDALDGAIARIQEHTPGLVFSEIGTPQYKAFAGPISKQLREGKMVEMTGGCLCDQVRYSANADPAFVGCAIARTVRSKLEQLSLSLLEFRNQRCRFKDKLRHSTTLAIVVNQLSGAFVRSAGLQSSQTRKEPCLSSVPAPAEVMEDMA
jgi:hypothetical protein